MKIALTVNYILDVEDENVFYNSKTNKLLDSLKNELNGRFPEELALSENVKGVRNCLTYIPLSENRNYVRCDSCGKYLSISENLYLGLDCLTVIKGRNLCLGCKWELENEL